MLMTTQFNFPARTRQFAYFKNSKTILVRLEDNTVWQSSNEGYTWQRLLADENVQIVAFYHHTFSSDRAYLITATNKYWYTTDTGRSWHKMTSQTLPNSFGLPVLHFHPLKSDYLIWTGNEGCTGFGENCHVQAHYSLMNGRDWKPIERYVRNCAWARDAELLIDPNQILCESYEVKQGDQRSFGMSNPLHLVSGTDFYSRKTQLFDHIVGFAKFSEYLIVAEVRSVLRSSLSALS